jgi:hypothetical protein
MESYVRANDSYSHADLEIFYLHGATALELVCKACLTSVHPGLIADPKHFESLLLLCDTPLDKLPPPAIKTITVTDALKRCQRVVPELTGLIESLEPLIRYRNDVAHLGLADFSFLRGSRRSPLDLLALARFFDVLLPKLNEPRERFYGAFAGAIEAQLREAASEVEVSTKAAIAAARLEFARRYDTSPGYHLREALYDSFDDYETQWYECPACPMDAKVTGYVVPEWETEQTEKDESKRTKLRVEFYPYEFYCKACGLELRGDQLEAAGIKGKWELDNVNPDDFQDVDDE